MCLAAVAYSIPWDLSLLDVGFLLCGVRGLRFLSFGDVAIQCPVMYLLECPALQLWLRVGLDRIVNRVGGALDLGFPLPFRGSVSNHTP
ncbi:hypothetical protein CCHOA_05195 [Corynebacterium choanae]|uniref:Uncharacterized protein n=1 Tax=Corynebacterium choanae TaxID=1862358 RepID=A0A3G6JBE4_9CORY|nr:hypothetical protein CCHOA_05195 [Corynebacterium choanae]